MNDLHEKIECLKSASIYDARGKINDVVDELLRILRTMENRIKKLEENINAG